MVKSNIERLNDFGRDLGLAQESFGKILAGNKATEIDRLLQEGWFIVSESGRQVVLCNGSGHSKTCYRPKTKK